MNNVQIIRGLKSISGWNQMEPFLGDFGISSSSETVMKSGLLIRQPLIWLHKFKSYTLRIDTFSNEESVRTSNKNPAGFVHLGFFVLVQTTLPTFRLFGSKWNQLVDITSNFCSCSSK